MDLHHPPCRGLLANRLFHACGLLAQKLLRAVQFHLLPKSARRNGLRPLIRHFVRTVARLVRAAGRHRLLFAKSNFRLDWIYAAAGQLEWTAAPGAHRKSPPKQARIQPHPLNRG